MNKYIFAVNASRECEESVFLFDKLLSFLKLNNYNFSEDMELCETVLVNTCSVVKGKINYAQTHIRQAMENPHVKKVIVYGCVKPEMLSINISKKVIFVGPTEMEKIKHMFKPKNMVDFFSGGTLNKALFQKYQERIGVDDYYILIGQGCVNNCTFCNTKKAKGRASSVPVKKIIAEIKKGTKAGYFEFVLLADDCGSYGFDIGTNLIGLIREIIEVDSRIKVKIYYLYPGFFLRYYKEIKELAVRGKITFIKIPLQTGSQRILKLMNRNYSLARIGSSIRNLKSAAPETWLATVMIVGFPTETPVNFLATLKLAAFLDEVLFFQYSDHPNVGSYKIVPKVSAPEVQKRLIVAKNFLKKSGIKGGVLIDDKGLATLEAK